MTLEQLNIVLQLVGTVGLVGLYSLPVADAVIIITSNSAEINIWSKRHYSFG